MELFIFSIEHRLHTANATLALQKAVLAPFALKQTRDEGEIRNPDQPPQQAGLGRVEETYTGKGFPVSLVQDVVRLKIGRLATRKIRVDKISTFGNISLI